MHENVEWLLRNELARAEAVVASETNDKKQHTPTIDNHRGQVMALQKALAWLEMEKPVVRTVIVEKPSQNWVIYCSLACLIVLVTVGASLVAAIWP